MARMTTWVRRYALRDLMDDSFDLFKEQAMSLLLAGLIPSCLVVLYAALMRNYYLPENLLRDYTSEALMAALTSPKVIIYLLGYSVCAWVGFSIGYLAQCRLAVRHALGESLRFSRNFTPLMKPFWSFLLVFMTYSALLTIVMLLVLFMGTTIVFLLLSPVIVTAQDGPGSTVVIIVAIVIMGALASMAYLWVTLQFLTAPIVLAFEHAGPFTAISRALRQQSANVKAQFFGLYAVSHTPLILFPLVLLVGWLLSLGFDKLWPSIGFEVIGNVVSVVTMVLTTASLACLQALVYVDARCRQEALDLHRLAEEIEMGDEFARVYQSSQTPRFVPRRRFTAAQPVVDAQVERLPSTAATGYPDYSAPPPPLETLAPAMSMVTASVLPDDAVPPPPPPDEPGADREAADAK